MRLATRAASSLAVSHPRGAKSLAMAGVGTPPGFWVAMVLLAFAAIWLQHLATHSLSPPVDNIEQLMWVRSLAWGYFKHPPLPTWIVWLPVQLFGLREGVLSLLGAACTLAALALMWQLLARLRGDKYAALALLAALCITYYNGRLNYYNHNVVLMLLSTLSAILCWQAFSTCRLRWWIALGVTLGLGALAKYQVVVTVASVLVFAMHQRAWRDRTHRKGLVLASLVALLIFAPHVAWLFTHDFAPIRYAVDSSLGAQLGPAERSFKAVHWLVDQVFNRALPALLLLCGAVGWRVIANSAPRIRLQSVVKKRVDPATALLLSWGGAPLIFMPLVGVATGADLQLHWGSPFLLFAVPALMEAWPRDIWQRAPWPRVAVAFTVVQSLLLTVNHLSGG
jgi:4-amino-4-deoxy-L-arabinose transferase-like glycosyltransferase